MSFDCINSFLFNLPYARSGDCFLLYHFFHFLFYVLGTFFSMCLLLFTSVVI